MLFSSIFFSDDNFADDDKVIIELSAKLALAVAATEAASAAYLAALSDCLEAELIVIDDFNN